MCNPVLVIAGVGLGLQVAGQYMNSQAQADSLEAQADMDEYNAKAADYEAISALAKGSRDEGRLRNTVKAFAGSQITAQAASGTDVGSGTNLLLQTDTARGGEADALTVRGNAVREGYRYKQQAEIYRYRAQVNKLTAKTTRKWGWLGAGGTLLSGSASIYGQSQQSSYSGG